MFQLVVDIRLDPPWGRFECVQITFSEWTESRIMFLKEILLRLTQRGRGLTLRELGRRTEVAMLHVEDRVVVLA